MKKGIKKEEQGEGGSVGTIKMINLNSYPFKKGSYEYYFDKYFDIPEGIPDNKYTDLEADKYALKMIQNDRTTNTIKED